MGQILNRQLVLDAEMECGVCLETYNLQARLPRSLTCGHTLCSKCITGILRVTRVLYCPFCRAYHSWFLSSALSIAVNYRLVQQMRESGEVLAPDTDAVENTEDHPPQQQLPRQAPLRHHQP
ncbi:RING finger protein 227-like [Homarus americanus]|uniref:RING finger protein 227-like n=1 Tax=Homarus americanus TaxID=6706 RepID=UPI001C45B727|nr:RING finger protein 227-like [Homarus americanus]